jgi:hypothetical protein
MFKPVRGNQTNCSSECNANYSQRRAEIVRQIRRKVGAGMSISEVRMILNIHVNEIMELYEIAVGEQTIKRPEKYSFPFSQFARIDEMELLGKYKIRPSWRLPNIPVNSDNAETVGDVSRINNE